MGGFAGQSHFQAAATDDGAGQSAHIQGLGDWQGTPPATQVGALGANWQPTDGVPNFGPVFGGAMGAGPWSFGMAPAPGTTHWAQQVPTDKLFVHLGSVWGSKRRQKTASRLAEIYSRGLPEVLWTRLGTSWCRRWPLTAPMSAEILSRRLRRPSRLLWGRSFVARGLILGSFQPLGALLVL